MTARDIQRRLIVDRYRRNFLLPNFTPRQWWECDVFELTPKGFFREYEIKLTRSDFRADAAKTKERFIGGNYPFTRIVECKHDMLAKADPRGPNQFWYVIPADLGVEVPAWAGVIYASSGRGGVPWNISLVIGRPAPMLHRQKIDPKVREYAEGICYWRFHSMFVYGTQSTPGTLTPDEIAAWGTELPDLPEPELAEARP